jgi:hypothetical protein
MTLWLLLCFMVLVFGILYILQQDALQTQLGFMLIMFALSFPMGMVATLLFGFVVASLLAAIDISYTAVWHMAFVWLVTVAAGYYQWFVLLPKASRAVIRAWRSR